MSATNRGAKRAAHDFYPTPESSVRSFLDNFPPFKDGIDILEPGAGSGNIIKVLKEYGEFNFDAIEIRPEELKTLTEIGANTLIGDFLEMNITKKYDLIIGNPPFNQAIDFVKKSLGLLKPNGKLVFLLRTAFMESNRRYEFWQDPRHKLSGLYTLHERPSFTGHGTDATSYSWFVWEPDNDTQTIKVI